MPDPTPILGQEVPARPHTSTWIGAAASIRYRVLNHVANVNNAVEYAGAKSDRPVGITQEDDIASGEQIRYAGEQGALRWVTLKSGETIAAGGLVEVAGAGGIVGPKTAGAGWTCGVSDENVTGVQKIFRIIWNPEYQDS